MNFNFIICGGYLKTVKSIYVYMYSVLSVCLLPIMFMYSVVIRTIRVQFQNIIRLIEIRSQ